MDDRRIGLVLALASSLLLLAWGYTQRERVFSGRNDFLQLYTGAALVGTPDLYSIEANRAWHVRTVGVWLESVYFSRLPFYAAFLKPLARLPYPAAYGLFLFANLLALCGFLRGYVPGCRDLKLFACMSVPLLMSFLAGQDAVIVLFLCGLGVGLLRRERDFCAGLVLSLAAIKPHLLSLVPLVLIAHRRWRVLAGGAVGGAGLLALSFASAGRDWPRQYAALLANSELHPGAQHMPNLRALTSFPGGESWFWQAGLSGLVMAAVLFLALRTRRTELALAYAIAGSLLISYHAYLFDCVLLLLVFAVILENHTGAALRGTVAIALTPPVYLCGLIGWPFSRVVPLCLLAILAVAVGYAAAPESEGARTARPLPQRCAN